MYQFCFRGVEFYFFKHSTGDALLRFLRFSDLPKNRSSVVLFRGIVLKDSCSEDSKQQWNTASVLGQTLEKYQWMSSFLVKLQAYNVQLYLKISTFSGISQICQLFRRTFFKASLTAASVHSKNEVY